MSLILQVIQTVVQEAPPKPTTHRGVGNYDVTVEYLTEAEAYHTLAEKVQLIREKEIQSWRQGIVIRPRLCGIEVALSAELEIG